MESPVKIIENFLSPTDCKYLIETDWSISEVAYACGYKSVSNFNKLFKETKNCCPKAFRVQFDK